MKYLAMFCGDFSPMLTLASVSVMCLRSVIYYRHSSFSQQFKCGDLVYLSVVLVM